MTENPFNVNRNADLPEGIDCYELLQISPNAEPETIHRVYRLLAQRYHPDNQQTGDPARFRALVQAYQLLSDPERRAAYDLSYHQAKQQRWRPIVSSPEPTRNPIELEHAVRLTVLEVLYQRRRTDPAHPGVFILDLEELTAHPREHLEFTLWYLTKKQFIAREDGSKLAITAEGVDYLEQQQLTHGVRRRLEAPERAS